MRMRGRAVTRLSRSAWDAIWCAAGVEAAVAAVDAYHQETLRQARETQPSEARRWAREALLPTVPGAASLSEDVEAYLRQRRPREAATAALLARQLVLRALAEDPGHASWGDREHRAWSRRCAERAEAELIEELRKDTASPGPAA